MSLEALLDLTFSSVLIASIIPFFTAGHGQQQPGRIANIIESDHDPAAVKSVITRIVPQGTPMEVKIIIIIIVIRIRGTWCGLFIRTLGLILSLSKSIILLLV